MASLRVALAAASLAVASHADAETITDWRPYTAEASTRFSVPVEWIEAVMQAESRGRTQIGGRPIRSSSGAMGLMQLMPATWANLRARLGLGHDPDDPRDNILAGTFYLRLMHERFGYPGLFAAYNAGPGRYRQYLAGRRTLPAETTNYLSKVAPRARALAASPVVTSPPMSIFAVRRAVPPAGSDEHRSALSPPLFVPLSQRE